MIVYRVFKKNYKAKKGEFMGMLIERRRYLRGLTRLESGLRWARLTFGRTIKDKHTVFIVPDEVNQGSNPQGLVEKLLFTNEELFEPIKSAEQQMGRIGRGP